MSKSIDIPLLSFSLSPADIQHPHGNDVLCGRGVTTNKWSGNEQFRSLVALNKELYVTSTKRQKMAISRSIVEAVRSMNPPGRFLERNNETGLWADIGDKKATEKTSQALRDGAATLRKQLSEDLGDPEFLNAVFDTDGSCSVEDSTCQPPRDNGKATAKASEKTIKKSHRRTKSMPEAIHNKTITRKILKTMDSSKNGRVSLAKSHPNSPLPVSHPLSPGSGTQQVYAHLTRPLSFPLGYASQSNEGYVERYSAPFDLPPRMGSYSSPLTHKRHHANTNIPSCGQFPLTVPSLPVRHTPSPEGYGGWNRPPKTPSRSSSGAPQHVSPTACTERVNPHLSIPNFPRSTGLHPLSPNRNLSPGSNGTPPLVSPPAFTPPMSPQLGNSMKREEPRILIANIAPKPIRELLRRCESPYGSRSPTEVAVGNDSGIHHRNKVNGLVMAEGVEVFLTDSPLQGDKIFLSASEMNFDPTFFDSDMTPDSCGSNNRQDSMVEIVDDLLRLPIAPVGPLDEGPAQPT